MHCSVIVTGMVVIVVLFYFTPRVLSHLTWHTTIKRFYKSSTEQCIRVFTYNHSKMDGLLVYNILKEHSLPPVTNERPTQVCNWWTTLRITNSHVNESEFLQLVSYICKHSITKSFRTTIFVSTRNKLKDWYTQGCFLKSANVYLKDTDTMSMQQIAERQRAAINKTISSDVLIDTLAERSELLSSKYIFNKWMLDVIDRDDGNTLHLIRGGKRKSLNYILQKKERMDLKCVCEGKGVWSILATPILAC